MKFKLVWIAIVLVIGAFIVNNRLEEKSKLEAEKAGLKCNVSSTQGATKKGAK